MRIEELTQDIHNLCQQITRRERVVCGPGEIRDKLRAEIKELYAQKKILVEQRDSLCMNRNAENVASQFGGIGTLSNDNRSLEERQADEERSIAASRAQFQKELASFA